MELRGWSKLQESDELVEAPMLVTIASGGDLIFTAKGEDVDATKFVDNTAEVKERAAAQSLSVAARIARKMC